MNGKVSLAYIAVSSLINKESGILQKIDFRKLTHICIAFAGIKPVGNIWLPYISNDTADRITEIKDEINNQNAETKILISVGGAFQDGFCQASRTSENRSLFVAEVKAIINKFQLDGVDIDWEFPGSSSLGIASCKNCKKDYILLLKELRNQLGKKLLTVAAGSNRFIGIDVKAIAETVDFVFVMTYDLGISHSNAFISKMFIRMWKFRGIPCRKLCLGVPFYGRNIKRLDESMDFSQISSGKIIHIAGQSFSYFEGKTWCFDTESDIKEKACWASKNDLAGIFCWEITSDSGNQLIGTMYSNIK